LYFELLNAHESAGDVPEWEAFVAELDALHASPATKSTSGVQIMTMHKAKGLEFDTVILAGLAEVGRKSHQALLRWRRRDAGLLIAPAKSRGGENDPLYRYLSQLDAESEDAELGRLLYVACTRAKARLHILAAPGIGANRETGELSWKDPVKSSPLAKLWNALEPELPLVTLRTASATTSEGLPLRRLPLDVRLPEPEDAVPGIAPPAERPLTPPFDWARETTRRIGTVAHRLLARIADEGAAAWPRERIVALDKRVRADLASAGFAADELAPAVQGVLDVVQRTLDDPRGRWLFDSSHQDARSEWALSGVDRGEIVRVVVDRTFVAEGERWIVDFKTSTHEGGDARAFLDNEVERYREQMARYGRMMAGLEKRRIRLALYYPLIDRGFREIVDPQAVGRERRGQDKGAQLSLW
jgi:ATP-dependent exoDNAse (exonuclease V) beta subunit